MSPVCKILRASGILPLPSRPLRKWRNARWRQQVGYALVLVLAKKMAVRQNVGYPVNKLPDDPLRYPLEQKSHRKGRALPVSFKPRLPCFATRENMIHVAT